MSMNFLLRAAAVASVLVGLAVVPASSQYTGSVQSAPLGADVPPAAPPPPPPPAAQQQPQRDRFSPGELIDAGHHFFGDVSRGFALVVEKAVSQWGQPHCE